MKVTIDEDRCIGCGGCAKICAEVFTMVDGYAKVALPQVPTTAQKAVLEAERKCPVKAISHSE